MMNNKEKILKKAQDLFEYSSKSTMRKNWVENYKNCKLYYEGDQWQDKEFNKDLDSIGAKRYTFNQIERMVNLYTSLQIRSGKRSGFGVKNQIKDEHKIIQTLKEQSYLIHTESDYSYYSSNKFTDMLIGGIGWSHYDYNNDKLLYRNVEPNEMYFDPDDISLKLDNSSFICRSHFQPLHKLVEIYPAKTEDFNNLILHNDNDDSSIAVDKLEDVWAKGKNIRTVEVQYKKLEKCFKVKLINKQREFLEDFKSRTFLIFDLKELEEIDFDENVEITETKATRIYKIVYFNDVLLEHKPLELQVPNQTSFSYIPVILRRDSENMPYGVVNTFVPLQDSRNYIWSTLLHYMDARTLIVNMDMASQADKTSIERIIRKEMKVKNGVLFTQTGKDYQIVDHNKDVQYKLTLLDNNLKEFETLSGLYNSELSGTDNKNLSGVAINMRSVNTMNAQNHILLAYDSMLVSEGKLLLDNIQGMENLDMSVLYDDKGEKVSGGIGFVYKTLDFEVYPDTTSNFSTSAEEDRIRFNEVLASPNVQVLLSSEVYLQSLGFSGNKAYELVEEYKRLNGTDESETETEDVPAEQISEVKQS